MLPIIPLACVVGLVASAIGLGWYHDLSDDERRAADEYAARLAKNLYNQALDQLAQHQLDVIHRLVRQKFA